MPSIEAKSGVRSIPEKKSYVESPKFAQQHIGDKAPQQNIKMPCSPYRECDNIMQEPPSSERNGGSHVIDSNGLSLATKSRVLKTTQPKTEMATEIAKKYPPGDTGTTRKTSEAEGDMQNANSKMSGEETVPKSKKPKPRSFSLLEMKYTEDSGKKGHGRLVRQKSVTNSFEKETHVLTHAASAPAAISDAVEPRTEDEVFGDDDKKKKSDNQQVKGSDGSSKSPTNVECSEKVVPTGNAEESEKFGLKGQDEKEELTESKNDEKESDTQNSQGQQISGDVTDKVEKGGDDRKPGTEAVDEDHHKTQEKGKSEEEKVVSLDAHEEEKSKTKMSGDVDHLTKELQSTLKLEDSGSKIEKHEPQSEEGQVSALAEDLHKGLSLKEKTDGKPFIKIEGCDIPSTEQGHTRLRARGLRKEGGPEVMLNSGSTFVQQAQWPPSQPPSNTPSLPYWQSQNQTLPSIPIFLRPQVRLNTYGQSSQSVVSPPGQGSHQHMVLMNSSGMQMVKIRAMSAQSRQIQYAQQQMQQNYQQNSLSANCGGPAMQMSTQQMNIPGKRPEENDWPLTPESLADVDEIIESITSDEESLRSPVMGEDEQVALDTGIFAGVPSPQSPWSGSHPASIASSSPAPSPYTENQQLSPFQKVPDVAAPWSPESSVGSPGEPFSPDNPTFIKVPGTMSSGKVTVSPMSPHSPIKRARHDSSESSHSPEAQEKITQLKRFLQGDPGASPSQVPCPGYPWPSPPPSSHTPPYNPVPSPPICTPTYAPPTPPPAPQTPVHIPQTQVPPQHSPPHMYPQPEALLEGELEAFRKQLSEWSVEALLRTDDDNDTVLHVAICKTMVSLSLAIIERFCHCRQKQSLNVVNKLHQTPLYLTVISNLPILTQILINYGADLTIGNKHGNTPLHAAAMNGNNEAIKAICEGISYCGYTEDFARKLFDATNFEGKTPLMLAVEAHGNPSPEGDFIDCRETVRLLLENGASSLQQDSKSGKTALHYAVELRKIDIIYILLKTCDDAGRLVNSQMYNGNTALHLIVGRALPQHEILDIVNLLMTCGANVGLDNAEREKPLDLVHRDHDEIKRRLHGHGRQLRR